MSFPIGVPQLPPEQHPHAVMYAGRMDEIHQHLKIAENRMRGIRETGREDAPSIEVIFVQLRKAVELIAFGSLIANHKLYSEQHATFQTDWRLYRVVERLRKVNPSFYPEALSEPKPVSTGAWHFEQAAEPFMNVEDMLRLYNVAGVLLHARNPFSPESSTVDIGFSVDEWIQRIKNLLRWHRIVLSDRTCWLVHAPDNDRARVFPSEAAS